MNDGLNGIGQKLFDIALSESSEEAKKQFRPSAEQVRQAAQNLVDKANYLKNKHNTVINQLNSLNTENENTVLDFSKKVVKSREEFIELMDKVFEFQNIVNAFLGQQVLMTFVYISPSSGEVTLYAMDNTVEHITTSRASKKRGGSTTGRYSTIGKIKKNSQIMINSNYDTNDKKTLDNTFKEVWQRYLISKAKIKMQGAAYILWKIGKWDGRWISGAGPLGEAYVSFFINEYVFTNQIEPAVADFMTNPIMGAELADNASGFLQGDVTKGKYELGVKIRGAQTLGYTDIIGYAQDLLQNEVDVEKFLIDLKNTLKEKGERNMVKTLEEKPREEIEILKNELEKRIEKIGIEFDIT